MSERLKSLVSTFAKKCAQKGVNPLNELEAMNAVCEGCGRDGAPIKRGGFKWCSETCINDRIEILSKMP